VAHTPLLRSLRAISRRRFVAGAAGAGAGALLLPRRARAAQPGTIAIVGGGIAGLTCALTLKDAGHAATVYEAGSRIGGRMHSETAHWDAGQVTEWCGELVDSDHETIHALVKRFGLSLADRFAGDAPGAADVFFFDGKRYPIADADRDFAPVLAAIRKDAHAGVDVDWQGGTRDARALDAMTIAEWIETRVPGGARSPMGALLSTAYLIENGAELDRQSALNLVFELEGQPVDGKLSIFGGSDERFHIEGGNQKLPEAIAASLGDAVVRERRLARLARTPAGRWSLDFESGARVLADHVVLALPFPALARVDLARAGLPARKLAAIRELGAGRCGKLQLQFTERAWTKAGSNGNVFSDLWCRNTWEVTRGQPGAPGILVDYTAGNTTIGLGPQEPWTKDAAPADARLFLSQIDKVFPSLSSSWNGKHACSKPHLDRDLGLSYSFYEPGQYALYAGYPGIADGSCHFAGEHTSDEAGGFMEGGAASGVRAAREITSS
jgi:monoamine oxidase